jgi:hypothetical protein
MANTSTTATPTTATPTTATPTTLSPASRQSTNFAPRPDMWVQLRDLPSIYSYDRALLICELIPDQWIAWVPDHGEMLLTRSAFLQAE